MLLLTRLLPKPRPDGTQLHFFSWCQSLKPRRKKLNKLKGRRFRVNGIFLMPVSWNEYTH